MESMNPKWIFEINPRLPFSVAERLEQGTRGQHRMFFYDTKTIFFKQHLFSSAPDSQEFE